MERFKIDTLTNNIWHVLQGEEQIGPFSYEQMIYMLQTLQIFDFNYVWGPHLESWTPIAQLTEFSYDRQQRLLEKNAGHEAFIKRQYKRIEFNHSVICHNNEELWKGHTTNLSEGGACVYLQTPLLVPGNLIILHFTKNTHEEVPFTIQAEVVSKKLTKQKIKHNTGMHYSVRFLHMQPSSQQQIKNWTE